MRPHLPPSAVAWTGGLASLALALAGCAAGPVDVTYPAPTGVALRRCAALVDALPDDLDGLQRREVRPEDAMAAAWGSPAVVLRCGVARPAALTPTSFCLVANGVGWLPTVDGVERPPESPTDETQVFTTIGQHPSVEVEVPGDRADDSAGFLAGLAEPVAAHTTRDPDACAG